MIKPLYNRVLIQELEEKTKGGIILADDDALKGQIRKGKVIDIGPEVFSIKKGMTVHFAVINADPVEDGDETYYLVAVDSVLAYEEKA